VDNHPRGQNFVDNDSDYRVIDCNNHNLVELVDTDNYSSFVFGNSLMLDVKEEVVAVVVLVHTLLLPRNILPNNVQDSIVQNQKKIFVKRFTS